MIKCVNNSNKKKQNNYQRFMPIGNCQRNVTDLAGSLVTSSRPLGWPQKRSDDRTSNASVAVRTADGSRRTGDAGEQRCLSGGCSFLSVIAVLCAADIDGLLHTLAGEQNFKHDVMNSAFSYFDILI